MAGASPERGAQGATHGLRAKESQETSIWQLPSAKMPLVFQGRTPRQLCRQLLDQKTNGGFSMARLLEYVEHHALVKWGWQPGDGRTKPPGNHAAFVESVRDWMQEGPNCPAE